MHAGYTNVAGFVVSPTSIRSRILKGGSAADAASSGSGFTHVDPFEDTESSLMLPRRYAEEQFHPRRSVRGY